MCSRCFPQVADEAKATESDGLNACRDFVVSSISFAGMNDSEAASKVCRRCNRPVVVSAESYDVFEQMHYVCFHYEFEHNPTDVDQECAAAGCPSASLASGREQVIDTARRLADEVALGAPWHNSQTHEYLYAFAAWLADSDGFYLNIKRVPPGNGWEVVNDALQAATVYE